VFGPELSQGLVRIPVDDDTALVDAIVRLASDADVRARLGEGGRAAVSGLTWERAARTTRDVFAQTLPR
jgi:glycosyltransferase involved in cell wall biosynthesis